MAKAIIFDKDGTLQDSEKINIESSVIAFKEIGIELNTEEKEMIAGRRSSDFLIEIAKNHKFDMEKIRKNIREKYYELYQETELIQEAIELLKNCYNAGFKIALCTSGGDTSVEMWLKKHDFKKYFDAIVTGDMVIRRKPEPDPYLLAAEKLGVQPRECVAIEDSHFGVESAYRAGMKVIAIPGIHSKHHEFKNATIILENATNITIEELKQMWKLKIDLPQPKYWTAEIFKYKQQCKIK